MSGDFDAGTRYSQLVSKQPTQEGGAHLMVQLSDERAMKLSTAIGTHSEFGRFLKGHLTIVNPDDSRSYLSTRVPDESSSGRLRIARRGEQVYFLYAQQDSPRFRLLRQQRISDADVDENAIQLLTIANGVGTTQVIWDDITLRAQRLMFVPSSQELNPPAVVVTNVSTNEVRKIAQPTSGYTHVGSPAWSPDGKQIAYDQSSGSTTQSRIMIVSADGGKPIDIGFGSMPTFSADGKRIAFSAAGQGVGFMNIDGSDRQPVDRSGWGMQWSPDGKTLAYSKDGNIYLWDVSKKATQPLMAGTAATKYDYVYWNMGWSRDSQRIAFKGRLRASGQDEGAIISLAQPDLVTVLPGTSHIGAGFSWSDDERYVLVSMHTPAVHGPMIHRIATDGTKLPELLTTQPLERKNVSAVWSPDGKSIAFTGTAKPESLQWPLRN
jgi:Tol biopolymer transport system component